MNRSFFVRGATAVHASLAALCLGVFSTSLFSAPHPPTPEEVFFPVPANLVSNDHPDPTPELLARPGYAQADSDDVLTLVGFVYKPEEADDNDVLPAVILLHGSSGLWSSSDMDNGVSFQYREWAEELTDLGYLVLMADSYHPRGISGGFGGRRPHFDPSLDDSSCSPNYERPKDVVAALQYLASRGDVDTNHIGILSFSQGAQTALNAVLDPTIDLSPYEETYIDQGGSTTHQVDSPIRIPNGTPFPKVVAAYYPGCGFFNYHGSPNNTAEGRYMPDTRTKVIMFHGTEDSLMGVDDPDATPLTGDLFPSKLVTASRAHANANGFADPFIHHYLFDHADHSFDNYSVKIEPEVNWGTDEESPDEAAKRIARRETLKQFAWFLKGIPIPVTPAFPSLPNVKAPNSGTGKAAGTKIAIEWNGETDLGYKVSWSPDGQSWDALSPVLFDKGRGIKFHIDPAFTQRGELALEVIPGPAPWTDARNLNSIRFIEENVRHSGR
ncbi:MAG: hypothetical protein CMO55_26395 [Verrucomicrobiales bacterium]|nr:hypothetical protein [Verrucomicrobiales bacterium]